MMPTLDSAGNLPAGGRYPCSFDEIEARFVADAAFGGSQTRQQIWNDFTMATGLLLGIANGLVSTVWIGGSFTSVKMDPSDIDVTYWIDGPIFDRMSAVRRNRVGQFLVPGYLRNSKGLRVDAYGPARYPEPQPMRDRNDLRPQVEAYFFSRGRWDDWWLRCRSGTFPAAHDEALAMRGYLEVSI